MAVPKATFFCFSFIFSLFHLFTMNVTRVISLETIKGEAGATSKGDGREDEETTHTHLARTSTPPKRDLGSAPSLESL
jgi:hypothetical protein